MEKFGGDPPFLTYSSFSISICLLHKQESLLLPIEVRFTEKISGADPNTVSDMHIQACFQPNNVFQLLSQNQASSQVKSKPVYSCRNHITGLEERLNMLLTSIASLTAAPQTNRERGASIEWRGPDNCRQWTMQ